MTRSHLSALPACLLAVTIASMPAAAQDEPATPAAPARPATPATPATPAPGSAPSVERIVPLDLEVVIARYQGDELVTRLPYTLAVNAGDRPEMSQLRMGAEVPVPSSVVAVKGDAQVPMIGPVNYRNVGTSIDCRATPVGDGSFRVFLSVEETSTLEETSAYVERETAGADPNELLVFRSFRSSNTMLLRDGQTRLFTAATDRVSGEMIRIEVTLRVVE